MLKSAPFALLILLYGYLIQLPGDILHWRALTPASQFSLLLNNPAKSSLADQALSKMTDDELIAQTVFPVVNVPKYFDDSDYARKIDALIETGIGGILLSPANPEITKRFTELHRTSAKVPLVFCADLENGLYSKTDFSLQLQPLMAWSASADSLTTYKAASAVAHLAQYLGIHFNLSPVADVNSQRDNAVISVRSFGQNAHLVSKQVNTYIKAMNDNNLYACVKHFPGHGNTAIDSHYGLPVVQHSLDELWQTDILPFRQLDENAHSAVMIGHLSVPGIDSSGLPATLSKRIITGVLRDKLGYQGVVISDALNMQAVQKEFTDSSAALLALNAGTDIILYPDNATITVRSLRNSYYRGLIDRGLLVRAVHRILEMKAQLNLLDAKQSIPVNNDLNQLRAEFSGIDSIIAEKSPALVSDIGGVVKSAAKKRNSIAHIVFYDGTLENSALRHFRAAANMSRISSNSLLENRMLNKREKLKLPKLKKDQVLIVSAFLRHSDYRKEENVKSTIFALKKLIAQHKQTLVFAFRNPYLYDMFGKKASLINMYGYSTHASVAFEKILNGSLSCKGIIPVSVDSTKPATEFVAVSEQDKNPVIKVNKSISFHKLDSLMIKAIADSVFPGAVALVAVDGKTVYEKAYGRYTYKKDAPKVKTTTLFDLASVSKVIATTTAVMVLTSEGRIRLDDPVIKYIPEFGAQNKSGITVRNLLLHNSGLPAFKRFYALCKNEDEVLTNIYQTELSYPTGTKTVYSDLGMITVGKIIERISGEKLDEYCKNHIFSPLKMVNTGYNPGKNGRKYDCMPTELDDYWRKRLLQGEVHDEAASMLNGVAGHAGLFSTADDLIKLVNVLMQNGMAGGKQLIKPEVINLFTERQSENSSRALGWDTKSDQGSSCGHLFSPGSFGHTGYTGTSVWVDPKKRGAVILLTNRVYPTRNNTKLIPFRPIFHDTVIRCLQQD